jgi:hypothetical protein
MLAQRRRGLPVRYRISWASSQPYIKAIAAITLQVVKRIDAHRFRVVPPQS